MKVNEIFTVDDAEKYIGNSKSWKKAWYASVRKWQLRAQGETSYCGLCGFCFVLFNRGMNCEDCPVWGGCAQGCYPETYLDYLRRIKKRIFALK